MNVHRDWWTFADLVKQAATEIRSKALNRICKGPQVFSAEFYIEVKFDQWFFLGLPYKKFLTPVFNKHNVILK